MQTLTTILFASISLVPGFLASTEAVELTNPNGDTIQAEIIRCEREYVTIRMDADGREIRTKLDLFSNESQQLIREWSVKQAIKKDLDFGASSKRFDSISENSESRSWEKSREGYSFRVTNRSNLPVEGLTLRYLIVIKRESIGRESPRDHTIEYTTGKLKVPVIPPDETVRIDSKAVTLMEEKMNPGWVPSRGGQKSSEDELEGVIFECHYKDQLVFKDSKPSSLLKDFTIEGPRQERQKGAVPVLLSPGS